MDSMDVITAFLHPEIDEEVYMELPEGYGIPNNKSLSPQECRQSYVCKVNKAIYGLKQAPRAWYSNVDTFLPSISFRQSSYDPNLYIYTQTTKVYLLLWVDDFILFYPTALASIAAKIKQQLSEKYRIKDLGKTKIFIGIQIEHD